MATFGSIEDVYKLTCISGTSLCTPFKNRKSLLTNGHSRIPVMTVIFLFFNLGDDDDSEKSDIFSPPAGAKNRLGGAAKCWKDK